VGVIVGVALPGRRGGVLLPVLRIGVGLLRTPSTGTRVPGPTIGVVVATPIEVRRIGCRVAQGSTTPLCPSASDKGVRVTDVLDSGGWNVGADVIQSVGVGFVCAAVKFNEKMGSEINKSTKLVAINTIGRAINCFCTSVPFRRDDQALRKGNYIEHLM
jgi:hypothetical protein